MDGEQVISTILNSPRFKQELDRVIQVAVIKGQFELLEELYAETTKQANIVSGTVSNTGVFQDMLQVFGHVSHNVRKRLDFEATTELEEQLETWDKQDEASREHE